MTLSNEQRINYSVQLQDKSDKYLSRFLLFSVVLIFLHLLEIEPSEIDVVGVKFNVKDSSVIYAAVSLIVIHNFYQTVSHSFTGSAMWKFSGERQIIKSFFMSALKTYKGDWNKARKIVRRKMLAYNIFLLPYALSVVLISLSALLYSVFNVINFVGYVWSNPPAFPK